MQASFKLAPSVIAVLAACVLASCLFGCESEQEAFKRSFFPVNSAGLTYGSALDVDEARERYIEAHPEIDLSQGDSEVTEATTPDLLAATSDDGVDGYIMTEKLPGDPATPAEALELTRRYEEGIFVDVYDAETMEIIGVLTLGGKND